MRLRVVWTVVIIVIVLVVVGLMRFNLSALQKPGHVETLVANQSKRFFIDRASHQGIPPRPQDIKASISGGGTYYGLDCSICHNDDGRAEGPPGKWMYPRASDLTSRRVQDYSDQELYWIIQNGIRYTGMPAFGKVETPEHIWDVVLYVRTLPGASQKQNSQK